MTIEGAIAELQNLIKADDVPFYYDGVIKKVIETIIDEQPIKCKEGIHFDHDGVSDYGRCSKKDIYEWNYKPTDFCSSGDRRERSE